MLRAALFGFHGVLLDETIHSDLIRRVLEEEGLRPAELADLPAGDDRERFAAALKAAGETAEAPRLARLAARKASYYRQRIRSHGYPFAAGAAALVEGLSAGGLMLGVVSGEPREQVEAALEQEGLLGRFKVIVAGDDAGDGELEVRAYLRVLEALNSRPPLPERLLHPHEVLAVEATRSGLEAAARAGLRTLGVAHGAAAAELEGADAVVASLAEVTAEELRTRFGGR